MSAGTDPSLEDLLKMTVSVTIGRVHTTTPGKILDYDPVLQRATVQPVLRIPYTHPDTGERKWTQLPPIANVPVLWPSGGGASMTWPLPSGSPGTLLVCERSTDEYRSTGGSDLSARDLRRFDWSDSLFLPAWRSFADPLPPDAYAEGAMVIRGDELRLGSALATDFVALATLTAARLAALEAAFNAHTHILAIAAAAGTGGTGTAAPTAAPVTITTAADVAATKVKAI